MEIDHSFHDQIASLCFKQYKTLPKSGKPKQSEWTVLSCIVMEAKFRLEVVALGTGSKCIGKNKMSAFGDILNDSHAEVMCRRSFMRYIYSQMKDSNCSILSFNEEIKKHSFKENVRFHFFTTHVPCGDAAIFPKQNDENFGSVIKSQTYMSRNEEIRDYEVPRKKIKTEGNDVFRTGGKCLAEDEKQDLKLQGDGYHVLGVVRTKPGRGDPTLSVSCSDKLSKWCHLGVQGALLTLLIEKPIYLSSFTIAANTPFCKKALERSLYDRLGDIKLHDPYFQNRMSIGQSSLQFEYSKDPVKHPCPSSISWCKVKEKSLEVAVEGKKQGVTKKNINTAAGRLSICKIELFNLFIEICELNNLDVIENFSIRTKSYKDVKMLALDYGNCWNLLRESFKVWTNKNKELLNFFCE